jgi:hypothetical protein
LLTVLALIATGLGLIDEIPRFTTPHFSATSLEERSDKAFVATMEQSLPDRSMVFELPYLSFPEGGNVGDMLDYGPLKGYLWGTGRLRWSYGGIRGRESDWQAMWSDQDTPRLARAVAAANFSAIYVDRFGFGDRGAALDAALRPLTGPPAGQSANGRLRWYDLRPLRRQLVNRLGFDALQTIGAAVTTTVTPRYGAGFGSPHTDSDGVLSRSVSGTATLELAQQGTGTNRLDVSFVVRGPTGAVVEVRAPGLYMTVAVAPAGVSVRLPLQHVQRVVAVDLSSPQEPVEVLSIAISDPYIAGLS